MAAVAACLVITSWAAPAAAHVEVEADNPQAGATNVLVSFTAESESNSAGIVSLEVALPEGITIDDVTLVTGPSGWALSPAASGYLVAGPALPAGTDAAYQIRIAQLPTNAETLAFKTLQTYTDGRIDRWIDIPTSAVPEPEMPAPILHITGAVPATTPPTATPTPEQTSAPAPNTSEPTSAAPEQPGSALGWWLGVAAAVLLAAAVAWWLQRRRRQSGEPR
jgi:Domain of unkown function (DUF1775)